MSEAKEAILGRIRQALRAAPEENQVLPPAYQIASTDAREVIIETFAHRVLEYRALLERVDARGLPAAIAAACAQYGVKRMVVPADVPDAWLPKEVEIRRDEPPLSYADLDASDGVLTGCYLAIAQTGTIILNGGSRQGRRALSLVPDLHLCVVEEAQVVGLVPEAIRKVGVTKQPITFISGPSATSDIELNRVEGVHGPRTLHVFVVSEENH